METKQYAYKQTIKRQFKLTDNQLNIAIQKGILKDVKVVKNPHYSSKSAYLFNIKEVEEHLDEIKQLPKFSEEEIEKRKKYQETSKKISEISFFCPLCKKKVRPKRDSYTRDAYLKDQVDAEQAKMVVIVTHFRHIHTDYDKIRKNDEELKNYLDEKEREEFNNILKSIDEAVKKEEYEIAEDYWFKLKKLKPKAVERLKDEKTKEAIELAKKNSLLPENFTKEKYDEVANRIKKLYGLD